MIQKKLNIGYAAIYKIDHEDRKKIVSFLVPRNLTEYKKAAR